MPEELTEEELTQPELENPLTVKQQVIAVHEQRYKQLRNAFSGLDNDENVAGDVPALAKQRRGKARAANIAWLAHQSGHSTKDIATIYDQERGRQAKHLFGMPEDPGDEGFYSAIADRYAEEEKIREEVHTAANHAANQAIISDFTENEEGERVDLPWSGKYADYKKDAEELTEEGEKIRAQAYRSQYTQGSAENEETKRIGRDILDQLSIEEGVDTEGPETDSKMEALDKLRLLDPDSRQRVYAFINANVDEGKVAPDWAANTAKAFNRGFINMAEDMNMDTLANLVVKVNRAAPEDLLIGPETSLTKRLGPAGILARVTVAKESDRLVSVMRKLGLTEPAANPEQIKLIREAAVEAKLNIDIANELREIRQQVINPIKTDNWFAENIWYPALGQVGFMSAASTLATLPAAFASNTQMRAREFEQAGVPFEQARDLGFISSLIEAPIERLQVKGVFGGALTGILRKNKIDLKSQFSTLTASFTGQVVEQNIQEGLQDITPHFVQWVASKLNGEIPEVKWDKVLEEYKGSRMETFWALLPMAALGAGIGTASDIQGAREFLTNKNKLVAMGVSDADSTRIADIALKDANKAGEEFAKVEKGPIDLEAFDGTRQEREDLLNSPDRPKSTILEDNKVEVEYESGWTQIYDSPVESQQAVNDFVNNRAEEARASVQGLIEAFNEAGVADITVEDRVKTLNEFVLEGKITPEQARQRIKDLAAETGVEFGDNAFASARVYAANEAQFNEGVFKNAVRVFKADNPFAVVEDVSEGFFKKWIYGGERPKFNEWLKQYQDATGDVLIEDIEGASNESMVEAMSSLATAYFTGQLPKSGFSNQLKKLFQQLATYFQYVFDRAARLEGAFKEGKLDPEFESRLAESVGFNISQRQNQAIQTERQAALRNLTKEVQKSHMGGTPVSNTKTFSTGTTTIHPTLTTEVIQGKNADVIGPATFAIDAFHGTTRDFRGFDIDKAGSVTDEGWWGWGLYFSPAPQVARAYTRDMKLEGGTYEVTLHVEDHELYDHDKAWHDQSRYVKDAMRGLEGEIQQDDPSFRIEPTEANDSVFNQFNRYFRDGTSQSSKAASLSMLEYGIKGASVFGGREVVVFSDKLIEIKDFKPTMAFEKYVDDIFAGRPTDFDPVTPETYKPPKPLAELLDSFLGDTTLSIGNVNVDLALGMAASEPALLDEHNAIADFWAQVALDEDGFTYPKTFSKRGSDIAETLSRPGRTMFPIVSEGSYVGFEIEETGADILLFPDEYGGWQINAEAASPDGKQLYTAAFDWLHNNGYHDVNPPHLTPINQKRKVSNMLSSALRWGSTEHLRSNFQQGLVLEEGQENFKSNIGKLAKKEAFHALGPVPQVAEGVFIDIEKGVLTDKKGAVFTAEQTKQLVKDIRDRTRVTDFLGTPERSPVGISTLVRALLTTAAEKGVVGPDQAPTVNKGLNQSAILPSTFSVGFNPTIEQREASIAKANAIRDRGFGFVDDPETDENTTVLTKDGEVVKGLTAMNLDQFPDRPPQHEVPAFMNSMVGGDHLQLAETLNLPMEEALEMTVRRIHGISVPDEFKGLGFGQALRLAHYQRHSDSYFFNSQQSPEAARSTLALVRKGLIDIAYQDPHRAASFKIGMPMSGAVTKITERGMDLDPFELVKTERPTFSVGVFPTKAEHAKNVADIKPLDRSVSFLGNTEVIRNPSPSDYKALTKQENREFPNARNDDPAIRSTRDKRGNTWIWRSSQGLHADIEPRISRAEGNVEVNQNFDVPTHREIVREALRDGQVLPDKVIAEYPQYKEFNDANKAKGTTMSIASEEIERALEDFFEPPDFRIDQLSKASSKLRRIEERFNKARNDADLNKAIVNRLETVQAVAQLEAIVSVLPMSVRGKIKGFATMASKPGDKGKMTYLMDRIGRVNEVLEEFIVKDNADKMRRLVNRSLPKTVNGKIRSTLGADGARFVQDVANVMDLETVQVDGQITELNNQITKDAENAERWYELLNVVETFGAINEMSAFESEQALDLLRESLADGRAEWRRSIESRKNREAGMIITAKQDAKLPVAPSPNDVEEAKEAEEGTGRRLLEGSKKFIVDHLSFRQSLITIFGYGKTTDHFEARAQKAKNDFTDKYLARRKDMADWMAENLGLKTERKQLKWWADLKTVQDETGIKDDTGTEVKMSKDQAIYYTMVWDQPAYRDNLERHNGFTVDTIAQMEEFIGDEGRQLRGYLRDIYDREYDRINEVYRALHGVDMPRVNLYAPVSVDVGDASDLQIEPFGNSSMVSGLAAGFTKLRTNHNLPVRRQGASSVYWAHSQQADYYVAYAEVAREMRSVLLDRDVLNGIKINKSSHRARQLNMWVDQFHNNGARRAGSLLAMEDLSLRMQNTTALVGLSWNLGTLLKQTSAILGTAAEIPAHEWAIGVGKMLIKPSTYFHIFKSSTIQRRIQAGMSIEMQIAMSSARQSPSVLMTAVRKGLPAIGMVDAVFTTVGASIAYEYHLKQAKKAGMNEADAKAAAMEKMDLTVGRTAQPASNMDRSLAEIHLDANAIGRVYMMFKSEPRQKIAIAILAARMLVKGERKMQNSQAILVTMFLMPMITQYMTVVYAALARDGDEDDLDPDNLFFNKAMLHALVTGQSSGLFFIGDAVEFLSATAFNQRVYKDSDQITDSVSSLARSMNQILEGKFNEEGTFKDFTKDVNSAARAMSLLIGGRFSALGVSSRIMKDIGGAVGNFSDYTLPAIEKETNKAIDDLLDQQEKLDEIKEAEPKEEGPKLSEQFKQLKKLRVGTVKEPGLRVQGIKKLLDSTPTPDRPDLISRLKDAKILSTTVQKQLDKLP